MLAARLFRTENSAAIGFFALLPLVWACLGGCSQGPTKGLGTLEWDQVHGRAVVSEPIVEIYAKEGDRLKKGDRILQLDPRVQAAEVASLQASVAEAKWHYAQMQAGYREQEIASAKAGLAGAEVQRQTRKIELDRDIELLDQQAISARNVDLSRNALQQAITAEAIAKEKLALLTIGYRDEEIQAAKSAYEAAQAKLEHAEEELRRYTVIAERDGVLDDLPFKLGDKPPAGAVVSTLLAGKQPWARIYLPEVWLGEIEIGSQVGIYVDGREQPFAGRVRHISSRASYTPYFTLAEDDRKRLSFVTEVDLLDQEATQLPLGIPVRMKLNTLPGEAE